MRTKTRLLMYLVNPNLPHYIGVVDEGVASSVARLDLSRDAWDDMDCPDVISVTVEPGDHLNEDA